MTTLTELNITRRNLLKVGGTRIATMKLPAGSFFFNQWGAAAVDAPVTDLFARC
jgi:hypothetical protein